MSYMPIKIPPGINTETPSLTSEPSWRSADKIRFKKGQPQKIGGWVIDESSYFALLGVPRSLHTWRLNSGSVLTAIGTNEKLYLRQTSSLITDITPLRVEGAALNATPLSTTSGLTLVTVTHTAHGSNTGDYVTLIGAVCATLVDAEVNANHKIIVLDDNSYTIEVTTAATGTNANDGGSSVTGDYEISIGPVSATADTGWGAGQWGIENYGDGRTLSAIETELRYWSLDHFGEDLVATHEAGRIYQWTYAASFTDRATLIANSPTYNQLVLVTSPDRHLVAFASENLGFQDRLLIRWADQETTTDWTPSAENTAGDQPLSSGSKILAVRKTQNSTLIWTDQGMFGMSFIGAPFTFSVTEIGTSCGAIGAGCVVVKDTVVFWMSRDNFFVYDGTVNVLPCTLHRDVFSNLNLIQLNKVTGGLNKQFNEIIWFYTVGASTENNRYVIYNYIENIWYNGTINRSCWEDSEQLTYPLAGTAVGSLYLHEYGTDDDISAMTAYIESSDFDLDEGDRALLISELVPDMSITTGSVDYTFKTKRYPHSTKTTDTTKTVSATTESINVRVRSKILALRIESDALSDDWRMGTPRIDIRPDGRRP